MKVIFLILLTHYRIKLVYNLRQNVKCSLMSNTELYYNVRTVVTYIKFIFFTKSKKLHLNSVLMVDMLVRIRCLTHVRYNSN